VEITTTPILDDELGRKDYIKEANLGDYILIFYTTKLSQIWVSKALEFLCISPLGALLQYTTFTTNVYVWDLFLSLSLKLKLRVVKLELVTQEIIKREESRCFEKELKVLVRGWEQSAQE
jgi:hypothetical protein